MYALVLFVHVASAMGIFAALAMEWLLASRLEAATSGPEAAAAAKAFGILPRVGAPSTILVLFTGIYLTTAGGLWHAGWPVAGLVGLVLIGATGGLLGSGRVARQARTLDATGAPARRVLQTPLQRASIGARAWLGLAVVYLMTVQPGPAGSGIVLGLALVLAAATLLWPRRRRMPAAL
jgi:hypothetical protein